MYIAILLFVSIFILTAHGHECGANWGHVTSRFIDETYSLLDELPPVELPIPGTVENVAVLVEPREDPCIRYVVKNILHFLPQGEWALQIMHGRDNVDYIKEQLYDLDLDRIVFTSFYDVIQRIDEERPFPKWIGDKWDTMWNDDMHPKNRESGKWNINRDIYSQGLLVPWFYEPIIAEHMLIFQTDSWLCDYGIERYLDYDYVGAMWRMCTYGESHVFWGHCMGGNGGLSLRKRSKMLELTTTGTRSTIAEDYQFALWFKQHGANVPSNALKREIFSEELEPLTKRTPIGIHKIWHYQNPHNVQEILRECMAPLRGLQTGIPPRKQVPAPKQQAHDEL